MSDRWVIDASIVDVWGSFEINGSDVATETWVSSNFASDSHTHSSTDGTFTTSDGKTVTVTNGIVTGIS